MPDLGIQGDIRHHNGAVFGKDHFENGVAARQFTHRLAAVRLDPETAFVSEAQQDGIYKQIGELLFTRHTNSPLFWTSAQAVVNPNIVADYAWPGSISGTWTHTEYIKAAQ